MRVRREQEEIVRKADIFVVIGTSLNVYPAAGLLWKIPTGIPVFLIDPGDMNIPQSLNVTHIKKVASEGIEVLKQMLRHKSE